MLCAYLAVAPLLAFAPVPAACAPDDNPVANAILAKRDELLAAGLVPSAGDVFTVQLETGLLPGVAVQDAAEGWTPLTDVEPWWGAATLVLQGHPDGTEIEALEFSGWGQSFTLRPSPMWEGRIHFRDITFYASGANALSIGRYGSDDFEPLQDVRFYDCTFLDHPDPAIRVIRPISANQSSLQFFGCTWNLPNSREHAVYTRNPFGVSGMYACDVIGIGAQCWQEVSRPSEGPYMGHGTTFLIANRFRNYHRDPGRSGSAITLAGTSRDAVVFANVVTDVERPEGEQSYGAMVVWDGTSYYDLSGQLIVPGDVDAGEYAVGDVWVMCNLFVQKDPNRATFKANSCKSLFLWGNGIFGSRPVTVLSHVDSQGDPWDAGIGHLTYGMNNGVFAYDLAGFSGIDPALLVDPDLRFLDEPIGKAGDIQSTAVLLLD